jgi:hypothetical protein
MVKSEIVVLCTAQQLTSVCEVVNDVDVKLTLFNIIKSVMPCLLDE